MNISFPPQLWDVTPAAAIGVQRELAVLVQTDRPISVEDVRLVAGVDVSSAKDDPMLTAGVVVWDRRTGEVVEHVHARSAGTFPYISGLLSFREIPVLLQAIKQLKREPDVWLVDGQGIAHPRKMGIAAHLGVLIDRPTIGVAKSRLSGTYAEPGPHPGDCASLIMGSEHVGYVLRTKQRSNPLFISPGHRIDPPSARAIVQACLRGYRLPEPTRLAHIYVNDIRMNSVHPQTAVPLL